MRNANVDKSDNHRAEQGEGDSLPETSRREISATDYLARQKVVNELLLEALTDPNPRSAAIGVLNGDLMQMEAFLMGSLRSALMAQPLSSESLAEVWRTIDKISRLMKQSFHCTHLQLRFEGDRSPRRQSAR